MPPSRESCLYTPFYCEENVWHLARRGDAAEGDRAVAIIANEHRTCALWHQRAAPQRELPVIWDYHVILITTGTAGAWVHDLDTTLGFPEPLASYMQQTFRPQLPIDPTLRPRFRLLAAGDYVAQLGSDRTHMLGPDGTYQASPPAWPIIGDETSRLPLMAAIDPLRGDVPGEVMDLPALLERFR